MLCFVRSSANGFVTTFSLGGESEWAGGSLPRWHPPNYSIFLADCLQVSFRCDPKEPLPRQLA